MTTNPQVACLSELLEDNCHFYFDQANAVAEIKIEACTQAQFDVLQQLLSDLIKNANQAQLFDKQANLDEKAAGKDYSQYFDAIMQSALYKPGNPHLAVMQGAKQYHLSVSDLKFAFINR